MRRSMIKLLGSSMMVITLAAGGVAGQPGAVAHAVCHNSSSFIVSATLDFGAVVQEESKIGVCNNNGGYQGRHRLKSGTLAECFFTMYGSQNGAHSSPCTTSTLWQNGPLFTDPGKKAPLWFCFGGQDWEDYLICPSGPWTNEGF